MPPDNLDPLRHIEGFPLGKDENLHALSNPPYYTAYPNPHIADFIKQYGKPYDEATDDYHREPFVADVSEGKNDPIYNAHSYHTKVPYKAIVPFIEHYTQPGEIIFDGFCGTGMTGVAAQSVGRRAILCDLSPAATFIASNYNTPVLSAHFELEARRILKSVETECGWMYETKHSDGRLGRINFTVWSDIFLCPYCKSEIVFWDAAYDEIKGEVREEFECKACKAKLGKRGLQRAANRFFDSVVGKEIVQTKQIPVLINYSIGGKKYEKKVDAFDLAILEKIASLEIPYWYPTDAVLGRGENWGDTWRSGYHYGITHIHHFYFDRTLWVLSKLWDEVRKIKDVRLRNQTIFWIQSVTLGFSKLNRYLRNAFSQVNRNLSGTLFIGSTISEVSPWYALTGKISRIAKASMFSKPTYSHVTTNSTTGTTVLSDSVDYIFTDPPFGDNLMYSELNFLWETWLKVRTNNQNEAIINQSQSKGTNEYRELMESAFSEMFRILKPGRWITVEFHNSKASVWNAIQDALMRAGFVVAQVTVLDKQQGSFKQVTSAGAVKNDLVINAYKPRAGFTQRLISQAGHGLEADFVREHLRQLPIAANAERSREMLYSKYLAYYVQHGYQVMYNGEQFYRALAQWGLEERDGYWFADEAQAHEYEQRKIKSFGKKGVAPQAVLFISDERSARQWVWNFLDTPKTYDEIYTKFVPALQTSEDEIPELKTMLEESFVMAGGAWKRPDQLTQAELEQKRLERLLRQFNEYLQTAKAGQKLKEIRKEAVIAGFTECYRAGKFQDIVTLGKKLDKRLLEESPELFDFVDIAEAKLD